MEQYIYLIVTFVAIAFGVFGVGMFAFKGKANKALEHAETEAEQVLKQARSDADQTVKEAQQEFKRESKKRRQSFEKEAKQRRSEISKLENKIKQREESLDKKLQILDARETDVESLNQKIRNEERKAIALTQEYETMLADTQSALRRISGMTPEEAKRELIKTLENDARKEASEKIQKIEEQAKQDAERVSQSVISVAVQRLAGEYVNDSTVAVVGLPSDEMKGRIIGREGRNIRAIEQFTGVDLIIDDTPEAVIVSCFNPIRREIAKITIERLVADGRIHPARIEETAMRVTEEMDSIVADLGDQACFELGITDLDSELVSYVGKLRFLSTGQQTVLAHSIEVAQICGFMASEMKLNVKVAKRAGLLHDIGKALDQDHDGHHAKIGTELLEKHNEHPDVISAVQLHHEEDLTNANPIAVVVHAANILSSQRPGARKEVMDSYIQRLEDMEGLVKGFRGVDGAFVMQAGREVRAIVSPVGISDKEVNGLSSDIAHKIRSELTFPGQVKVTVIRESQAVDFAK